MYEHSTQSRLRSADITQIVTKSKLALLNAWQANELENELQANESEAVWVTEKIQTNVSKYPFYGVWMPSSFMDQTKWKFH